MQNPQNQILNFSLLKTTEKFYCNNTRPTWPESTSNIMKIMYGHFWSNIGLFQHTAQNQTPCPKFWSFQIWTFLHWKFKNILFCSFETLGII